MSKLRGKPVNHGRDHMPGGSDPIPGLGGSGGIQFETKPQDGQWLWIEVTGDHYPPSAGDGAAMVFVDSTDLVAFPFDTGGILLRSTTDVEMRGGAPDGSSQVSSILASASGVAAQILDTGSIVLDAGPNRSRLEMSGTAAGSGSASLTSDGTIAIQSDLQTQLFTSNGPTVMLLGLGQVFRVTDSSANVLLEVRDDQTFHILTGASWVADL